MFAWILKTNPEKRGRSGSMRPLVEFAWQRRRREVEEALEERLDAEVVHGAPEEDGRDVAGEKRRLVEGVPRLEKLELVLERGVRGRPERRDEIGVVEGHVHRRDALALGRVAALVAQERLAPAVVHALEVGSSADRPRDGVAGDPEDALDLVHEVERVLAGAVELVDERDDRDPPHPADLEELDRLRLDALGAVDEHDGRVRGRERAVRVLGEVVVARRVEEVHVVPAYGNCRTLVVIEIPRWRSSSIQSLVVCRWFLRVLTEPARWIAPP
jgi:hypothetical protein